MKTEKIEACWNGYWCLSWFTRWIWVDLLELNSSEVLPFGIPGLLLKWWLTFEIRIDSCSICKTKGLDDPISCSFDGELILEKVLLGSLPNEIVNFVVSTLAVVLSSSKNLLLLSITWPSLDYHLTQKSNCSINVLISGSILIRSSQGCLCFP